MYGLNAETNGWNPGSNQWAPSGLQVTRTIFDTLTAFDEGGGLHPYLLESYDHNAEFTEWTLELRPGVKLHNGTEVTAETLVRNQNYFKSSPVTKQAYRYIESFTATSPTTVVITDRQFIVDEVQLGLFEVADGPFAPSSPWYAESGHPPFDPAAARALVESVKARHGGTFAFTIKGSAEPTTARTLQLLQQQWSEVGIDATIETVEQAKLIIGVVTGDYQAVQWQQFDSADPVNDGVWWTPENAVAPPEFSLNFARYGNPAMGEALKALRTDETLEGQREAVAEIQRIMGRDVPYVWLYHAQFAIVARPDLVNITNYTLPDGATGLGLHMGAHPLYQVWIDGDR